MYKTALMLCLFLHPSIWSSFFYHQCLPWNKEASSRQQVVFLLSLCAGFFLDKIGKGLLQGQINLVGFKVKEGQETDVATLILLCTSSHDLLVKISSNNQSTNFCCSI